MIDKAIDDKIAAFKGYPSDTQFTAEFIVHILEDLKRESSIEQMVRDFHTKYNCYMSDRPVHAPWAVQDVRVRLIDEESDELASAMDDCASLSDIAKEIADVVYVAVGAAVTYGIPFAKVFELVHASNMTKTGEREDGKIMKGPNYVPPDLSFLNKENPNV